MLITIHLSQKKPLTSRCTISEEITAIHIVIYRSTLCIFEIIVLMHNKYLLKICQHIIQSQRYKKTSITLKRVLKNATKWFDSDSHFILTKYKLINQGVKTINNQYYNTHQNRLYRIPLQKVISTTITVTHHVWTGRLRRYLRPLQTN